MREPARTKASRLLLEGRLIVTLVQPGQVQATTRGEGLLHHQALYSGQWTCTCRVRTDQCSHLIALRRVVAIDLEHDR